MERVTLLAVDAKRRILRIFVFFLSLRIFEGAEKDFLQVILAILDQICQKAFQTFDLSSE